MKLEFMYLPTQDLDAALALYRDTLGFDELWREGEVTVGHSATVHGCYVEKGSLVGIGATILDGARIGQYSLIAAGSLVTPNTQIPERSFVVGAPARVKRQLTDQEIENFQRFWQGYVTLSAVYQLSK